MTSATLFAGKQCMAGLTAPSISLERGTASPGGPLPRRRRMIVEGQTSIGPAEPKPEASDASGPAPAIVDGVDAQDANAFDMRRGLAGAEAKAFSPQAQAPTQAERPTPDEKPGKHEASSSEPTDDRNRGDPNERSDMISERRHPGQHGTGGNTGEKSAQ